MTAGTADFACLMSPYRDAKRREAKSPERMQAKLYFSDGEKSFSALNDELASNKHKAQK